MWTLELDDSLVRLCVDQEVIYEQPGIAHMDGKNVTFGDEALARLFSDPVHTHTTFWQRMNEDTLELGSKSSFKNSDLVHQQLVEAVRSTKQRLTAPGLVVVPCDYDADQIGLLWGILEFLNLPPSSFVDSSLLASLQADFDSSAAYIDFQLERTLIAELTAEVQKVTVERVDVRTSGGSIHLMKRCIDAVAERSLDETRFDPRVLGETEQQLFDALRRFTNNDADFQVNLNYRGETHSLSLPHNELEARTQETFEGILNDFPEAELFILSKSSSQLPGLLQFLRETGTTVELFNADSQRTALTNLVSRLQEQDEVSLLKSFERESLQERTALTNPPSISKKDPDAKSIEPTHALYGNVAHPIQIRHSIAFGEAIFGTLEQLDGEVLLQPINGQRVFINDLPVPVQQRVFSGDRIQLSSDTDGNREVVLIHVVEHG